MFLDKKLTKLRLKKNKNKKDICLTKQKTILQLFEKFFAPKTLGIKNLSFFTDQSFNFMLRSEGSVQFIVLPEEVKRDIERKRALVRSKSGKHGFVSHKLLNISERRISQFFFLPDLSDQIPASEFFCFVF